MMMGQPVQSGMMGQPAHPGMMAGQLNHMGQPLQMGMMGQQPVRSAPAPPPPKMNLQQARIFLNLKRHKRLREATHYNLT